MIGRPGTSTLARGVMVALAATLMTFSLAPHDRAPTGRLLLASLLLAVSFLGLAIRSRRSAVDSFWGGFVLLALLVVIGAWTGVSPVEEAWWIKGLLLAVLALAGLETRREVRYTPGPEPEVAKMSERENTSQTSGSRQIEALAAELERQTNEVEELVSDVTDERFLERTPEGRWSIGEHLFHMVLTNRAYLDSIEESLERARSTGRGGDGPFRIGRFMGWFIKSMEPPVTRRLRTFRKVVPPHDLQRVPVHDAFRDQQRRLATTLRATRGLDLGRAKLRSPLFRPLTMSAFEGFSLLAAHNRRHVWHIAQLVDGHAGANARP